MSDSVSKSWFCVWNNPQDTLELTEPTEIAEKVLEMFIGDSPTRSGAVAYCVSAMGLHHLHMVFEDIKAMRFSAIKKAFPKIHLEPTKGTKEQAQDYIDKKGKFEEKGEKVLYIAKHGEIKGCQGQRKDIDAVEQFIREGKTPNEIFDMYLGYRRYEKMIRDAYYRKREKETPFIRDIEVYWHVGLAGSGKTYVANKLVEQYGMDNVYFNADYESGGLDRYNGERVLFLDEFKGQIRYSTLLCMLQGYKQQFHARYSNITGLWTEVHISSVFPPELCYSKMVSEHSEIDTIQQLLRRITEVVYHYKVGDEYKELREPIAEYKNYKKLQQKANYEDVEWIPIQEKLPFD